MTDRDRQRLDKKLARLVDTYLSKLDAEEVELLLQEHAQAVRDQYVEGLPVDDTDADDISDDTDE